MSKNAIRFGLALAATLAPPAAMAEPFGQKGQFAISGDRIFGIHYTHESLPNNAAGQEQSISSTQFSLLGQIPSLPLANVGGLGVVGAIGVNPYSVPRISFDYLVIDGLTIGGSLIYAHTSNSFKSGNVSTDYSGNMFGISPRVGYAYMFSEAVGIWPRGGFTYYYQNADLGGGDKDSMDGFALNLDAPFIISPIDQFAFLVGPALDIGLAGSSKVTRNVGPLGTQTVESDLTLLGFGLYAGLMGWI